MIFNYKFENDFVENSKFKVINYKEVIRFIKIIRNTIFMIKTNKGDYKISVAK
ncbi:MULTISPECIES: hypothetical protein [unclassified Clostridium]|uniref:hypothetical protein n=1 Tax=unclassified Clostridium TaxID=2614128 RepID=UPI00189A2947|nr:MULTISPECIES: hypothetical protein [unclassified Clostridium]MCR1953075.1 hypothetical protein [Clostridium sp. DSM 100503]